MLKTDTQKLSHLHIECQNEVAMVDTTTIRLRAHNFIVTERCTNIAISLFMCVQTLNAHSSIDCHGICCLACSLLTLGRVTRNRYPHHALCAPHAYFMCVQTLNAHSSIDCHGICCLACSLLTLGRVTRNRYPHHALCAPHAYV